MPTPPPAADENATPLYGIRYPKATAKAYTLPTKLADLATDMETVLHDAAMPAVISSAIIVAASSTARDSHWGTPTTSTARLALQGLGATTIRTDLGIVQQYFANLTDGGTNPGGRTTAGWYQVSASGTTGSLLAAVKTTAQSLASSTSGSTSIVTWDSATGNPFVTSPAFTFTTATGVAVCNIAGNYDVTGWLTYAANGAGNRGAAIWKALAATPTTFFYQDVNLVPGLPAVSSYLNQVVVKSLLPMAVGDVLRLEGLQSSGSALNVNSAAFRIVAA